MTKVESCLEYANSINLDEVESLRLLWENTHIRQDPQQFGNFRFVSGREIFHNTLYHGHGRYPGQKGDCGIYWTTSYGKVLGMTSFNIHAEEDFLKIVQIQGTRAEYLSKIEKSALKMLPWEMSLISLVENIGTEKGFSSVKMISPNDIPSIHSGKMNPKKTTRKYKISALQRGFFPSEDNDEWYKPL